MACIHKGTTWVTSQDSGGASLPLVAAWGSVADADAFPQLLEPLPWPFGEGGTAAAGMEAEAVMALLPLRESSER